MSWAGGGVLLAFYRAVTTFLVFTCLLRQGFWDAFLFLLVKKLRHRKVASLNQTHTANWWLSRTWGPGTVTSCHLNHPAPCFCRDMLMCQKTKLPVFRLVIFLSGSVIPPNSQRIIISSCLETQVQPYAKLWLPGVPEVTVTP